MPLGRGRPRRGRARPTVVEGVPTLVEGVPTLVEPVPTLVEGVPTLVELVETTGAAWPGVGSGVRRDVLGRLRRPAGADLVDRSHDTAVAHAGPQVSDAHGGAGSARRAGPARGGRRAGRRVREQPPPTGVVRCPERHERCLASRLGRDVLRLAWYAPRDDGGAWDPSSRLRCTRSRHEPCSGRSFRVAALTARGATQKAYRCKVRAASAYTGSVLGCQKRHRRAGRTRQAEARHGPGATRRTLHDVPGTGARRSGGLLAYAATCTPTTAGRAPKQAEPAPPCASLTCGPACATAVSWLRSTRSGTGRPAKGEARHTSRLSRRRAGRRPVVSTRARPRGDTLHEHREHGSTPAWIKFESRAWGQARAA